MLGKFRQKQLSELHTHLECAFQISGNNEKSLVSIVKYIDLDKEQNRLSEISLSKNDKTR